MRRFVFRLEAVLKHRETLENLREQEFAQSQGHLLTLQARLTGLQEEFDRVLAGRPGRAGEHFDAHSILDRERYLETVKAAIEQQARRVETAQIVVEEQRQWLMMARQAREAVSQLREKDLAAHTALTQKVEQDGLDEQATLRHVRATMRKAA